MAQISYEEWLARQPRLMPLIRCVAMSHPSWSEDILISLDDANGTTVTESTAAGFYPFAPFAEKQKDIGTSLDTGYDCQFGGYNKEVYDLLQSTDFTVQDFISYRTMKFNANDTSYIMEDTQLYVYGINLVHDKGEQYAGFEAVPPQSKFNQTGTIYLVNDIPMLESFL